MTDPSIPTSLNRGHIRAVTDPGALHREPIPGHCRPLRLEVARREACRRHVHNADLQVTDLFRTRTRDNESSLCQVGVSEVIFGARVRPIASVGVAWLSGSGSDFAEEPVCREESRPR
jgi:hypothetical protein